MARVALAFAAGFLCGAGFVYVAFKGPGGAASQTSPPEMPRAQSVAVAQPGTTRTQCAVQWVMDGDSLQCAENAMRVRLLLIDSPERGQTEFHDAARDFLTQLLPRGSNAALEIDVEPKDAFGRTLAYVWLPDGRMANEELVRAGLALAFPYKGVNVRYLPRILAAQQRAQEQLVGFWKEGPITCTPQQFRHKECAGFQ